MTIGSAVALHPRTGTNDDSQLECGLSDPAITAVRSPSREQVGNSSTSEVMGYMAAAKKPQRKAKVAEKSVPRPSRFWRMLTGLWRPIPLLMAAVALTALMFWPEIVRHLPDLRSRQEYQLAWADITVPPPGRWVPSDLIAQVQRKSGLPDPLPVLDDGLVEKLSIDFANHPWVAEVMSVSKDGPQSVRVQMRYRTPVLMVRTKRGGLYPVDREGILLPPSDFKAADAERFPIATQVRSLPVGPAGTPWGDEAVVGAARLAVAIIDDQDRSPAWETFGMAAISILAPQQPAKSLEEVTLGLTTHAGSQVVWGRPPGADLLEPTVEQKLLRLDKYLPKYGEEGWSKAVRLDVWQWDVVDKVEISRDTQEETRFE